MTKQRGTKKKAQATAALYQNSTIAVATRNLLNMAAVAAASATILLCLMMMRSF